MKYLMTGIVSLVILFACHQVAAQGRWSLELQSGAAYATEDLGDADIGAGFGFEVSAAYRLMPHLSAYAGWGWNKFSADNSLAGADVNFEETGYTFGLQFIHPFGESRVSYLFQAGAIYNHIETENGDGDIIADSGHGLGWQLGVGLAIPLGERWRVTPGVRYRSLSRDIEMADVKTAVDLNYLSAGVGFSWSF